MLGLFGDLGVIHSDARNCREGLEHRQRGFREWELSEHVRHFSQQTCSVQASLRSHPKEHSIKPADVTVLQDLELESFQLEEVFFIGGGTETRESSPRFIWVAMAAKVKTRSTPSCRADSMRRRQKTYFP